MESSIISFISTAIEAHQYSVPFLGSFFGGEETIIALTILSYHGLVPLFAIFLFSLLGTVASDTLWFFVGKTLLFDKMISHKYFRKGYDRIAWVIDSIFRGNHFVSLLVTKFLYGTRIITIMYISREKIPFKIFFVYNVLTTLVWLPVVMAIGWFAGKGISAVAVSKNMQAVVVFMVIFIGVLHLLRIWINKFIIKRQLSKD